jgi:CRP-like cAMP-binding protein
MHMHSYAADICKLQIGTANEHSRVRIPFRAILSPLGKYPDEPPEWEIPMATKLTAVTKKKAQKTPIEPTASLSLVLPQAVMLSPVASCEPPPSLDPHHLLTKLSAGKSSQEYKADESVFSQGDVADAVFFVQSGKVKLTVVSTHGREAVVAILPEGSFFGEGCLTGQQFRMSTASAVERSTILRVSKSAMVALLHQDPQFAERFLAYLLSRNVRMEADLVDHLFNSSEKRLARLLLLMANFGQESKPISLVARMSQETLAEMIGTTRSRVSFFMNRFRELGFLEYNSGGMQVHSSLLSVVLHD